MPNSLLKPRFHLNNTSDNKKPHVLYGCVTWGAILPESALYFDFPLPYLVPVLIRAVIAFSNCSSIAMSL